MVRDRAAGSDTTGSRLPTYKWQPSTAEIARRAGISPSEVIRFDHNTSPSRPPWAVPEAADAAAGINEYPAADYRPLREAAAAHWGLEVDHVVAGAGIDELIGLCAKAFLRPSERAVGPTPTYPLYRIVTAQRGADFVTLPTTAPDFAIPLEALVRETRAAAVTWFCLPNNPSGREEPGELVTTVASQSGGIVVVDAAYAEFADDDWTEMVRRHANLVVLHTLSKAHGLAGIRVGYSLSRPELADRLHAVRPPGSISTVSAALAVRSFADGWYRQNVASIVADRQQLADLLGGVGFRVLPSATNFLLCEVGSEAQAIADQVLTVGLVIRSFRRDPLKSYLRFTVRAPAAHERLIETLEQALAHTGGNSDGLGRDA